MGLDWSKLEPDKIKAALSYFQRSKTEKAILRHPEVTAKHLKIGIEATDIVDRINAFDWLDLQNADTAQKFNIIMWRIYEQFNVKVDHDARGIVFLAFATKFEEAVKFIKRGIENVHASYNIEGGGRGFTNPTIDQFYYISYWADKKGIPVNFNEKRQEHRALFNMDTIVLSILADKLEQFNKYEREKPKK